MENKKSEFPMSIKKLSISNFQSHKHSSLNLDPGVNVIVGPSDSGKTAIIRALRWLVWNRPSGDAIRSWWGGDTEVHISLPTTSISRSKGKDNSYKLDDISFKAMGTEVPEEIKKEINFVDINLQQQLDRPFLLDDSPGEVAKHFNSVAQLTVIDRGMANVKHWIREIEQEDKTRRSQLKESIAELKTYNYLDKMEQEVVALEYLEQEKIKTGQEIGKLKKIIEEYTQIEPEIAACLYLTQLETPVNDLLSLFAQQKVLRNKHKELQNLLETFTKLEQEYKETQHFLKIEKPLDKILLSFHKKKLLEKKKGELKETIEDITYLTEAIIHCKKERKTLEVLLPSICPFCGQSMKGIR